MSEINTCNLKTIHYILKKNTFMKLISREILFYLSVLHKMEMYIYKFMKNILVIHLINVFKLTTINTKSE